jgi:hypothetical protein
LARSAIAENRSGHARFKCIDDGSTAANAAQLSPRRNFVCWRAGAGRERRYLDGGHGIFAE